jgi:hypothetical protein
MKRAFSTYLPAALLAAALVTGLVTGLGGAARAEAPGPRVVVELYTSQGCNSCPPADALLGRLAKRKDVLALSFHVDYWDYLGWKDTFALHAATTRQREYARHFHRGYVYTPQMVIDGRAEVVGSRSWSVESAIKKALKRGGDLVVRLEEDKSGAYVAVLPDAPKPEAAAVYMVLFDNAHTTDIKRGENGGKKLTYHNVVRAIRKVGSYDGKAKRLKLPVVENAGHEKRDGCAVLVQSTETGGILGAGVMALK